MIALLAAIYVLGVAFFVGSMWGEEKLSWDPHGREAFPLIAVWPLALGVKYLRRLFR